MKQVYTSIILLIVMLFSAMTIAQEGQKRYINYQGVARNADGTLMNGESLTIGVKLNFGSSGSSYEESHDLNTDTNGVFSLSIGNGNVVSGDYANLPWGDFATTATISINGNEIGTTELMAVPHALSSADNQWHTMGDDIENKNGGNVFVTGSLYVSKDLSLAEGAVVNEFSTDITLAENSDAIVPTQKAIKTYVDSQLGGGGGGADDQTASEVAYDNSTSGLTATTAQDAIDELVDSGAVDADADPNNEIQDISLVGTELTISDGSTIDLAPIVPPGGTDDQNLILTGDVLSIENGSGSVDLSSYAGDDADADPTNEIDVTSENGLLLGDGSVITGLVGTANGQVAKWNAGTNSWEAGTDATGGGGGSSLWTDNGGDIFYNSGKVGVGTNTPEANIAIETDGNQWNLSATEGDFRIGDATHRLKMGVAIDGAGAGDARIRVEGGTDRMMLGGGTNDVLTITDQNVGIGTITPATKLHVDGDIRSNDLAGVGERNVVADANGNLIIGAGGGGSSLWSENGGDVYYDTGDVGIGTDSPSAHLHISEPGASGTPQLLLEENSTGFSTLRFKNLGKVALWDIAAKGDDGVPGAANSTLKFHFENDQGSADRMVLTGGGNLGINVNSPSERLQVGGTIRSTDLAGAGERNVVADANGNLTIGAGGGGSSLWSESGSNIYYNGGKVGIGTDNPSVPLEISTSDARQLVLKSTTNDNYMQYITPAGFIGYSGVWSGNSDIDFGTTSSNATGKVHLTTGATPKLTVAANGDVGIGTTSPSSKLDINGNIKTSGEVNRPSTGNANMVPIAYGNVQGNAVINSGSGNFSVNRTGPGNYRITINGEGYFYKDYTTVANINTGDPGFIGTNSIGGSLLTISTNDIAGSPKDTPFTFVVYKQ